MSTSQNRKKWICRVIGHNHKHFGYLKVVDSETGAEGQAEQKLCRCGSGIIVIPTLTIVNLVPTTEAELK